MLRIGGGNQAAQARNLGQNRQLFDAPRKAEHQRADQGQSPNHRQQHHGSPRNPQRFQQIRAEEQHAARGHRHGQSAEEGGAPGGRQRHFEGPQIPRIQRLEPGPGPRRTHSGQIQAVLVGRQLA